MAQVQLSDELYKHLEQFANESDEFSTVDEYVAYILQQVVDKKKSTQQAEGQQDGTYSKDDEDKIRERLKNLGYLD